MQRGAEMAVADINAKGGVLGKQAEARGRRRRLRSEAGRRGRQRLVGKGVVFVAGHFCSRLVDPGLGGLYREKASCRSRRPRPTRRSPTRRQEGLEQRLPHLRPRRPAGRGRRHSTSPTSYKGKNVAIIHDKSAYGKGLADETKKAMNAAGLQGGDVRGDHTRASRTSPRWSAR